MSPPGSRYQQQGLLIVPNVVSLRALNSPATGNGTPIVFLEGTSALNDGGQGFFVWNTTSTSPDDGVTIIASNWEPVQGRWISLGTSNSAVTEFITSGSYAFTTTDQIGLLIVTGSGGGVQTLPPIAGSLGRRLTIKNYTTGVITVAADATIDKQTAPIGMQQGDSLTLAGVGSSINAWVST